MEKERSSWEPEKIAGMTNEEIISRLKELVPTFALDAFIARTAEYLSCDELVDAEYYPVAKFTDVDEDFIWMACEELWKRLVPDKPSVEFVAGQIDKLIEEMIVASQNKRWKELYRRRCEALDLLCRYTIEETSSGRHLRRDFYEKLCKISCYDFEEFLDDLIQNMIGHEEYERVIDVAGILAEGLGDDIFLDYKAESLFGMGKKEEGEKLSQEIISRNPDNPWFLLSAGGYYINYGEKDLQKAKECCLKALAIAQKHLGRPDSKEELRALYEMLIYISYETGDNDGIDRYERLLKSLESKRVGRNAPCPCGSGKKYKKCCGRMETEAQKPSFDRRLMERDLLALRQALEGKDFSSVDEMNQYIRELNQDGELPQWEPKTPLEQAQSLIYEALETVGKRRLKLVEQALKISMDCTDAYILLAEEIAESPEEALKLYEAGMEAGERVLGKDIFEKEAGHFWSMVETRPYMRARLGIAQCLFSMGKREEAANHLHELLRLNPNDNQGVRYLLASALLDMKKVDDLEKLLGQYDEATAHWLFTKALVAYIRQGDTEASRQLLRAALDANPHVASYILGETKLPKTLPDRIGFGDTSEAVSYAAEFGGGWFGIQGAVDWLASVAGRRCGTWQKPRKAGGIPEVFLKEFEGEDRKGKHRKLSE